MKKIVLGAALLSALAVQANPLSISATALTHWKKDAYFTNSGQPFAVSEKTSETPAQQYVGVGMRVKF